MIKFDEVNTQMLEKFKGGEGITQAKLLVDENNKIMLGRLAKGCSIGEHSHDTGSEIIYVLSGEATFTLNGEVETGKPGDCHYCKMGSRHSTANYGDEDLVFFAVIPEHCK